MWDSWNSHISTLAWIINRISQSHSIINRNNTHIHLILNCTIADRPFPTYSFDKQPTDKTKTNEELLICKRNKQYKRSKQTNPTNMTSLPAYVWNSGEWMLCILFVGLLMCVYCFKNVLWHGLVPWHVHSHTLTQSAPQVAIGSVCWGLNPLSVSGVNEDQGAWVSDQAFLSGPRPPSSKDKPDYYGMHS